MAELQDQNKLVVRNALERMHRGDLAVFEEHPGFHETAYEIPLTLAGFPDLEFRIEHMIAEGDWVAYKAWRAGTNTGEFHGMRPSNRRAEWLAICMDRVEEGRVVEHRAIPDIASLRSQLGAG